jgi:ubiquinone/menaquinone biosynthesis C-methylase UbiE
LLCLHNVFKKTSYKFIAEYLAYRDLPEIIFAHVKRRKALDFGCGTGRSTRFLKKIGFAAIGVDISEDMLQQACARDPEGDYRLIEAGGIHRPPGSYAAGFARDFKHELAERP